MLDVTNLVAQRDELISQLQQRTNERDTVTRIVENLKGAIAAYNEVIKQCDTPSASASSSNTKEASATTQPTPEGRPTTESPSAPMMSGETTAA